MTKQFQARQGDVMIRSVSAIPAGAQPVETKGRVVLAYGEVTGHAHAFYGGRVTMYRDDALARTFLRIEAGPSGEGQDLKHEEHSTIAVPPGDYEVIRQREYSPEEIRQVAD